MWPFGGSRIWGKRWLGGKGLTCITMLMPCPYPTICNLTTFQRYSTMSLFPWNLTMMRFYSRPLWCGNNSRVTSAEIDMHTHTVQCLCMYVIIMAADHLPCGKISSAHLLGWVSRNLWQDSSSYSEYNIPAEFLRATSIFDLCTTADELPPTCTYMHIIEINCWHCTYFNKKYRLLPSASWEVCLPDTNPPLINEYSGSSPSCNTI